MPLIVRMVGQLGSGNRRERATAAATLVMWFACGAFIASTAAHYLDQIITSGLPGGSVEVVGGLAAMMLAVILKTS
jgi:hypothetical protein